MNTSNTPQYPFPSSPTREIKRVDIDGRVYTYSIPFVGSKSQNISPDDHLLMNMETLLEKPGYRERILEILKRREIKKNASEKIS